ncbi:hypothetical protein [Streptomyces sp. NPDC014623]|uniref:hypothetical protein n=1 Tax=Streptomyces sp. NPDC014623 TaxID=3364875 RepID=UPI0037005F61
MAAERPGSTGPDIEEIHMCRCPDTKVRPGDPCADHCPQELDHERYFARGLPAPCGCTPSK